MRFICNGSISLWRARFHAILLFIPLIYSIYWQCAFFFSFFFSFLLYLFAFCVCKWHLMCNFYGSMSYRQSQLIHVTNHVTWSLIKEKMILKLSINAGLCSRVCCWWVALATYLLVTVVFYRLNATISWLRKT